MSSAGLSGISALLLFLPTQEWLPYLVFKARSFAPGDSLNYHPHTSFGIYPNCLESFGIFSCIYILDSQRYCKLLQNWDHKFLQPSQYQAQCLIFGRRSMNPCFIINYREQVFSMFFSLCSLIGSWMQKAFSNLNKLTTLVKRNNHYTLK